MNDVPSGGGGPAGGPAGGAVGNAGGGAPGGGSGQPSAPASAPVPAQAPVSPREAEMKFVSDAMRQMESDPNDFEDLPPTEDVTPTPPAPPAPPVAAPAAQPAAPVPGQPGAQPAQPTEPQFADPFEVAAKDLRENEPKFVEALRNRMYNISDEDMNKMLAGDKTVVSNALARVHVNSVSSLMHTMSRYVPVMVSHIIAETLKNHETENAFWASNPFLDKQKHRTHLGPIVKAYRAANPSVDMPAMHKIIGQLVAAAAGVQVPQGAAVPNGGGGPRTPGPVVRQAPSAYAPAGGSPGSAPAASSAPVTGDWGRMFDIMKASEAGQFDPR